MTLMKEHFMREDEKYNEIRDQREMKRNYISTISARCNPDIIVPS
jgi:AmiR/NasT family two-component response regulator